MPAALQLETGVLISERFLIGDELGRGGNAIVYKAFDLVMNRDTALKFLPHLQTGGEQATREFEALRQEVVLMQMLRHPNIATVYDLYLHLGTPFFNMQLLEGRTLDQKVRKTRTGQLPIEAVVHYAKQVISAIQTAHQQDVIHRDFKPLNIMVREGADWTEDWLTVLDFGLARVAEGDDSEGETIVGTPYILAPEMIDKRTYPVRDHRIDVYAIGVVIFFLLTKGHYPIKRANAAATILAQLREPPDPVVKHRPDTPMVLQLIINKCLQKNPNDRFNNAQEILDILDSFMDDPKKSILRLQSLRKGRIAVVDPDADQMRIVADQLELTGVYVHRFANPNHALDVVGKEPLKALFVSGSYDDDLLRGVHTAATISSPKDPPAMVILGGAPPALRDIPEDVHVIPEPVTVRLLGRTLREIGLLRPKVGDDE